MAESSDYDPFEDPSLRHEAGEGWHPGGLNTALLGAIVIRNSYGQEIEQIKTDGLLVPPTLRDSYEHFVNHVETLKERFEIGPPPPLSPDEA